MDRPTEYFRSAASDRSDVENRCFRLRFPNANMWDTLSIPTPIKLLWVSLRSYTNRTRGGSVYIGRQNVTDNRSRSRDSSLLSVFLQPSSIHYSHPRGRVYISRLYVLTHAKNTLERSHLQGERACLCRATKIGHERVHYDSAQHRRHTQAKRVIYAGKTRRLKPSQNTADRRRAGQSKTTLPSLPAPP